MYLATAAASVIGGGDGFVAADRMQTRPEGEYRGARAGVPPS
jgi:hypothetical protein